MATEHFSRFKRRQTQMIRSSSLNAIKDLYIDDSKTAKTSIKRSLSFSPRLERSEQRVTLSEMMLRARATSSSTTGTSEQQRVTLSEMMLRINTGNGRRINNSNQINQ